MPTPASRSAAMPAPTRWTLCSRALAAVGGAYLFTWGAVACGAVLLARAGMAKSEAVMVFSMLGFVIYLLAALWAIATRRLGRAWLVLAGGGLVLTWLGRYLAQVPGGVG